jgi:bifunctional DNase/RNase
LKKIVLEIVGLTYSQNHQGAYNLVLEEVNGKRKLPIVIGGFEAQAIAVELEKMKPSRPLTHDLFKTLADGFGITVSEVIIHNLLEGVFYAKIICTNGEKLIEMDARTSDAIAVSVRFNCPIVTYESILSKAGISLHQEQNKLEAENLNEEPIIVVGENELNEKSTEELKQLLNDALDEEDYEKASQIRDELNRRKKS